MTREIRFSTANFVDQTDDTCYLDPNDPLHEYMRTGDSTALNKPRTASREDQHAENQRKLALAKEQGIKPGSPAWFAL